MATAASAERSALCDLFEAVGPDAPTLCGDWTTRDLAAHIVVRERRPDGAAGIVAKPFADYGEKVRQAEAGKPFETIVERVRSGPPIWMPTRVDAIDRLANTVEFFVHHEDVRRAEDGWTVRSLDPELVADLVSAMRRMGKLLVRRAPAGLTLVITDAPGGPVTVVAKRAEPMVTATGPVGELTLFTYGRQAQAEVELSGPEDAIEAMRSASMGV